MLMTWELATVIIGVVMGISGLIGIFWANTKNNLVKQQTDNYDKTILTYKGLVESQDEKIRVLQGEVKSLHQLHTESVNMIGQLQGELKGWKELPIRELAEHMAYVSEVQYIIAKHLNIDHLPKLNVKRPRK